MPFLEKIFVLKHQRFGIVASLLFELRFRCVRLISLQLVLILEISLPPMQPSKKKDGHNP